MPYCGSWKDHRKQYDFCSTELEGPHINIGGTDFPESTEIHLKNLTLFSMDVSGTAQMCES